MKKTFLGILLLIACIASVRSQTLYATLPAGGNANLGTLIKFVPATKTVTVEHNFIADSTEGVNPAGTVVQATNGKLYGMTGNGGANNLGTIYSFDIASSTFTKLLDFDGTNGAHPQGSLIQATNGKLYGLTTQGGLGAGVIFSYDPATHSLVKIKEFTGADGYNPNGHLIQATDGKLYGTAVSGGDYNSGVIYSIDPTSLTYSKLHDFSGIDGSFPASGLAQATNGKLYAITSQGGTGKAPIDLPATFGVIFSFDPATLTYEKLADFKNIGGFADGAFGYSDFTQAADGKLYSMTSRGGRGFTGSIIVLDPSTSTYVKSDLSILNAGGVYPYGNFLKASDGKLYAMTSQSIGAYRGAIFSYDIATSSIDSLHNFNLGEQGADPNIGSGFIEVKPTPPTGCTVPTLSAAITNVSCKGSSTGGIVLSATGGSSPFTYAWTGPNAFTATTKDLGNVKAGLYSVKVTATGGCYFNASYRVTEPAAPLAINLGQGTIVCYGGTTHVDVYGSGGTTPYTGTGVFNGKTAGTYTYTITDAKGCSATGSITVVQPAAILSTVVINPVSCKGSSTGGIDLTVSGGIGNFTYAWTGPNGFMATTQDISNVPGGLYSVRVGSGQCYTNATYRVTEPLAPLGASISASTIACAGGTTNVYISPSGGTAPYTGGGTIANQSAGAHSYTVTDAKGCTYTASINIPAGTGTKPTTPVISGPTSVTANQANVQYTASTSGASGYVWTVPAGASITAGQNTRTITVKFGSSGGQVQVTATNFCGSSAQVSKTVSIGSARLITKTITAQLTTEQYFTTSPNPAQGMVTVKFSAAKNDRKYEIRISDVNGKTMFTKSGLTTAGDNMLRLDMTKYSSSIYFITLISDDQLQTQKLIKAK